MSRKHAMELKQSPSSNELVSISTLNDSDLDTVAYTQALFADSMKTTYVGKYHRFYSGGKLQEEGLLMVDYFIGTYKRYYPNGIVEMEGHFDSNGNKVGVWKFNDSSGTPLPEANFPTKHKKRIKKKYRATVRMDDIPTPFNPSDVAEWFILVLDKIE